MSSCPPEPRRAAVMLSCVGGTALAAPAPVRTVRARVAPGPLPEPQHGHPNPLDLARIERLLGQRSRYRYVSPVVRATAAGYEIASPNCSRSVDAGGGVIPIARLRFDRVLGWRLFWRDHIEGRWRPDGDHRRLADAISHLNQDPQRVFWP